MVTTPPLGLLKVRSVSGTGFVCTTAQTTRGREVCDLNWLGDFVHLSDGVKFLKGVGASRATALAKMGIHTILDLLEFFPREYIDRSKISRVSELYDGQLATLVVERQGEAMQRSGVAGSKTTSKMQLTRMYFTDGTGRVSVTFFNQPYMATNFEPGKKYYLSGRVVFGEYGLSLEQVEYDAYDPDGLSAGRIVPVYKLTAGLTQKTIRPLIKDALDNCVNQMTDFLPNELRQSQGLCDREFAIANIHYPVDSKSFYEARKRLVFDELFLLQAALMTAKGHLRHKTTPFENLDADPVLSELPFKLTPDQQAVVDDVIADFASGYALNRLLQGDVGSGKTAVAQILCYLAVKNGGQAAMMAPTETLARQHFASFSELFSGLGITCGLLVGSQKVKEKREVKTCLANGDIDIVVGTHALLQDNVEFDNLKFVITDEQHRFGVRQRATLASKGGVPHTLVMTATPIPRSLAMVLYGDMDISAIRNLPPGRQKIDTHSVTRAYHPRIFNFIKKEVAAGRQAYIICPLIEDTKDEVEVKTSKKELTQVVKFAEELKADVFADLNVGILHGRMKSDEKNEIMTHFAKQQLDVLVSTTVIEVGINVPNATVIMIENAERFGLSQLHQLRGRVGRGSEKSYCILITDSKGEVTKKRMEAMARTNDGFELSELDLELRGPGEFFGTAQHGLPKLMLANLYQDMEVLAQAKEAAQNMQMAKHPPLEQKIKQLLTKMQQIAL